MPGHTSAHGSKSKSHGDTSRGPRNSPFSSGFQGARKTSTKTTPNNNNNRETYRTTPRTIDAGVRRRNELALKVAKQKKDAESFKNYTYEDSRSGISAIGLLMDVTGLGKKGHEINKSYYQRNVIGRKKPTGGFYGASIEDYKGYMRGRGSGELDASGRTIVRGDGGGDYSGSFVVEKNVGGSTILTETKTEAEKTTDEEYDARKTKRRGRRRTILTSQTGAGGNLVLGKPSLLGA